jgi:hypothetical protein
MLRFTRLQLQTKQFNGYAAGAPDGATNTVAPLLRATAKVNTNAVQVVEEA